MNNDNLDDGDVSALLPASTQSYAAIMDKIHLQHHTLGIRNSGISIQQLPSKDNEHTAVCNATVEGQGRSATSFGIATPKLCNDSTDVQELVATAGNRAYANALFQIQALVPSGHTPSEGVKAVSPSPNVPHSYGGNQSYQGKHSDRKSASPKQMSLINRMSVEQQVNVAEIALDVCKKTLDQLTSADANTLI
ncbi:MAG: hypothetical protein LBT59_21270 [Clostridiales bacterium]|jgi:hypothetical protein|nr:hypothetical protein [Clostridiales bacterium]